MWVNYSIRKDAAHGLTSYKQCTAVYCKKSVGISQYNYSYPYIPYTNILIMSNTNDAFHSNLNWAGFCPVICEQYVFSIFHIISSFFTSVICLRLTHYKALFPNSYLLYTLREHSDITLARLSDPHNNGQIEMVAWLFECYGGCKLALLIGSRGCYRDGWWLKASKFPRKSICWRGRPRNTFAREEPLQWASSLHTSPSQMEQAIAKSHPLGARTYTCFHTRHSRTHAMPMEFLLIKGDKGINDYL